MSVNQASPDAVSPVLGYDRTLERRYVHRRALSEVFLTDFAELGRDEFLIAAMLPSAHSYYHDHRQPGSDPAESPPLVDSMLLMECARQAATYVAHRRLGVPMDSAFLVSGWRMRATGAHWPQTGPEPGRLGIECSVTSRQVRGGAVRGADFLLALRLDGDPVAELEIAARYTPADEADLVRRYRRRNAPPWSTALPAVPPGRAVDAADVARGDPANVLLFDADRSRAATDSGRITAKLGTRPGHRTLYDHPQDHYPAMILMEAARQAALLATGGQRGPARAVDGYRARFDQFAELDAPVEVTAVIGTDPVAADSGSGQAVVVQFGQHGDLVSEVIATVAPLAPGDARAGSDQ